MVVTSSLAGGSKRGVFLAKTQSLT